MNHSPSPATDARERVLSTAYELFRNHGLQVGIDRIVAEAGVAKMTLYRHYPSKDELAIAVIGRRVELWTLGWLVPEAERRAETPAGRVLALFEAYDEWFRGQALEDFQGCLFTNSLLEIHDPRHPVGVASRAGILEVRVVLRRLLAEAGARDPDELARRCHLLMQGAIVAATMGDLDAALAARAVAEVLLESEGLLP